MAKLAPLPDRPRPSAGLFDRNNEIPLNKAPVLSAAGNPNSIRTVNAGDCVAVAGQGNELIGQEQLMYFDYNMHALKKGLSSALLDVALLMANVSQVKSVYLSGHTHPFYVLLMVLLISSIILQLVAGVLVIFLGRININVPDNTKHRQAEVLANIFLISIFLLTTINIFISALGISDEYYPKSRERDTSTKCSSFTNNETGR